MPEDRTIEAEPEVPGDALVAAIAARHVELAETLGPLHGAELGHDTLLPGWDRLTIACHLRYGAAASGRMTSETLNALPTSFYPEGRAVQRPATLRPLDGESAEEVVTSLDDESRRLDALLAAVDDHHWRTTISEPPDNQDLGEIDLWMLALLRLTEVEVHGYDLDLGLSPWSATFVAAALPTRLRWLPTRRSNHRATDRSIDRTWALIGTDGPSFLVTANGADTEVSQTDDVQGADAEIIASSRQLLAFILGRTTLASLQVRGEPMIAQSFLTAFPAP